MTTVEKFNINRIRNEVKDLSAEEQIKELRRYKSDFLRLPTLSRVQLFETPFDQQADIEIERLGHEVSDTPNVFKVSSKSGAKSDLLQIFYSLHKLHLIEKKTCQFTEFNVIPVSIAIMRRVFGWSLQANRISCLSLYLRCFFGG